MIFSGSISEIDREQNNNTKERSSIAYDEELYTLCMRRFLYVRCYDSFEFLATLKVRNSFTFNFFSKCYCVVYEFFLEMLLLLLKGKSEPTQWKRCKKIKTIYLP